MLDIIIHWLTKFRPELPIGYELWRKEIIQHNMGTPIYNIIF